MKKNCCFTDEIDWSRQAVLEQADFVNFNHYVLKVVQVLKAIKELHGENQANVHKKQVIALLNREIPDATSEPI